MSQYPSPEQLTLPGQDDLSPDQQYYVGWFVQHQRLWLLCMGLAVLCVLQFLYITVQVVKYKPAIAYVSFDGGYPVVWNERGNPVVDDREYVPPRLRHVVTEFVENRYAYDWQNIQRLNTALRYMSDKAQKDERVKLEAVAPQTNILGVRLFVRLKPDWSQWKVKPLGKGRFEVVVEGLAEINDAVRYTDPHNPATKPFSVTLTIQTVPATDANPFGYVIDATGRDPIL